MGFGLSTELPELTTNNICHERPNFFMQCLESKAAMHNELSNSHSGEQKN